jgi:hypothetical protein
LKTITADTNINSVITFGLLLTIIILLYFAINKKLQKRIRLSNQDLDFEPRAEQLRLYLLFFGITIPIVETVVNIFKLSKSSHLTFNLVIGLLLLSLYFLSKKLPLLYKNINVIFSICYLLYFSYLSYNVYFEKFELVTFVALILSYILSYFVIKNFTHYLSLIHI